MKTLIKGFVLAALIVLFVHGMAALEAMVMP